MNAPTSSTHLDKVLAHAERQLLSQGRRKPSDIIDLYRKFLKIEEHRLRLEHQAGGGGLEICRRRAGLIDVLLRHLFDGASASAKENGHHRLSALAIGGYGRGELNPFSDVDVMFLHDGKGGTPDAHANEVIEQILYMLWDIGFKVGHSTRSIPQAIEQAGADMKSMTSLLESRRIAGDRELADQLEKTFASKCIAKRGEEYLAWRMRDQNERHEKNGRTVSLQEPNVKNGCGGLRDYQNLLWVAACKLGTRSLTALVEGKYLADTERRSLKKAYDFLLRVRTELHYQNKRATDLLTLYYQGQIANRFEYPQRNVIKRSEAFMRDYYRHARNVYLITATVCERLALTAPREEKVPRVFAFLARPKPRKEAFDGFIAHGGLIHPGPKDPFKEDPHRLMRVFLHAQQRALKLSPELQQLIRRRLDLVNRTFQYARATRETFETILSSKGQVGRILRMMHEVDFLGRYLPEFGELTCLVQHEFFHRYTADEHTLVCIEKLDALIDTREERFRGYRELFQKLEDPAALYLAILLHDTGKAGGGRHHSEASALKAQRVAARLQLGSERRRHLIFLVDDHITLSSTAQRRNLEDPATISEFSGIVKNQENLDALMLLTLADGQATAGEQTWSDWKESLVWQLYRETTGYLEHGLDFWRQRRREHAHLQAEVERKLPEAYREEIAVHFGSMPETYFRVYEPGDIASHIRLFRNFLTQIAKNDPAVALKPVTKWIARPDQGHSEVLVCTWDREGLLARLAACFAVARLNILSADIYTRSDNLVLDVFRVCDTQLRAVEDTRSIERFESALAESTTGEEFDFRPLLEKARKRTASQPAPEIDFPTRITISNDAHPNYTVIDLQTPDRLGLLSEVLRAISSAKADIAFSRIATEKGAAIDSFYVNRRGGGKLASSQEIARLQKALQRATAPPEN